MIKVDDLLLLDYGYKCRLALVTDFKEMIDKKIGVEVDDGTHVSILGACNWDGSILITNLGNYLEESE